MPKYNVVVCKEKYDKVICDKVGEVIADFALEAQAKLNAGILLGTFPSNAQLEEGERNSSC